MFTGIISDIGTIVDAEQAGSLRLIIRCHYHFRSLFTGESVAVNGACLTVTASGKIGQGFRADPFDSWFSAELSAETVSRTAPGRWAQGQPVNLERAVLLGNPLDGHLVTGHVDGVATVKSISPAGDSQVFELEAPEALARYIAEKGSVTLDGVSLTVNRVESARFWVNIIPHTLINTTLGLRKPGEGVNLEIDLIARYVERLLAK